MKRRLRKLEAGIAKLAADRAKQVRRPHWTIEVRRNGRVVRRHVASDERTAQAIAAPYREAGSAVRVLPPEVEA